VGRHEAPTPDPRRPRRRSEASGVAEVSDGTRAFPLVSRRPRGGPPAVLAAFDDLPRRRHRLRHGTRVVKSTVARRRNNGVAMRMSPISPISGVRGNNLMAGGSAPPSPHSPRRQRCGSRPRRSANGRSGWKPKRTLSPQLGRREPMLLCSPKAKTPAAELKKKGLVTSTPTLTARRSPHRGHHSLGSSTLWRWVASDVIEAANTPRLGGCPLAAPRRWTAAGSPQERTNAPGGPQESSQNVRQ